jgi:hypothetical protein
MGSACATDRVENARAMARAGDAIRIMGYLQGDVISVYRIPAAWIIAMVLPILLYKQHRYAGARQ